MFGRLNKIVFNLWLFLLEKNVKISIKNFVLSIWLKMMKEEMILLWNFGDWFYKILSNLKYYFFKEKE